MSATIAFAAVYGCELPQGRLDAVLRLCGRRPVSRIADRPVPLPIVRAGSAHPTSEEEVRWAEAEGIARGARLAPLLAAVKNDGPDVALEAAREHRRRYAGLEDEYIVDPIIVRLLVELDREQEALLEMEQSEYIQFALGTESGSDVQALYAYLNARAGTVWRPYWSKWLEANRSGRRSFARLLGERDPWYRPDFVPTASDTIAHSSLTLAWYPRSPATLLRILRRAHEAAPDDPNVKRALAREEWRTAKDYDKAYRLIREVIAVAEREHVGSLKQEEGLYMAAVRYRREHGGG